VRLEVYDVLGQKVRTLVQGNAEPGFHRATWDSRDEGGRAVAGGVYFCRLQAGEFTQVRKLLLLK
jgi:flagellar hook assembly protein FlgD